jgi:hypothetical protein
VAELAPPAQYTDAAGVVDFYRINGDGGGFGTTGIQFTLLQTDESDTMYRVRFVSVFGSLSGSEGGGADQRVYIVPAAAGAAAA